MCYDQEKTQAPIETIGGQIGFDPRHEREINEKRMAFQGNAGCGRPLMTEAQTLAELFKYHAPTPETLPKYAAINQAAKNFAEVVLQNCPSSADRSAAIRLIRDARMTANASVALNGLTL